MDIDKKVEYWHNNETGQTLQEFLDLSDKEYEEWLKKGNAILSEKAGGDPEY